MANMYRRGGSRQMPVAAMVPAIALAAAGGYALYRSMSDDRGRRRYTGDAPGVSLRNKRTRRELAHAVVIINRPREELYAYWRDFGNLPNFMENVKSVEETGDGLSRWTIKAPGGQEVELVSRITQEVAGRIHHLGIDLSVGHPQCRARAVQGRPAGTRHHRDGAHRL